MQPQREAEASSRSAWKGEGEKRLGGGVILIGGKEKKMSREGNFFSARERAAMFINR